jgi:hypothetical protein
MEVAGVPRQRLLPQKDDLIRMVASGMSHQDIVDETFRRTGERVTRAAVSAALSRAGQEPLRPRYEDLIPWKVKVKHGNHYALRMLRAEARSRQGIAIPEVEARRLESWKRILKVNKAVVHYDPDTEQGFFYVEPRAKDRDLIRIPDQVAA